MQKSSLRGRINLLHSLKRLGKVESEDDQLASVLSELRANYGRIESELESELWLELCLMPRRLN